MQRHHQTPPSGPDSSESHAPLYAARVPLQADAALHFIGTEVPPPSYLPYAATVGREVPGGAVMYWGEGGQRTPLHYDPYENFMCASECARPSHMPVSVLKAAPPLGIARCRCVLGRHCD
jgi:hypothetical protein